MKSICAEWVHGMGSNFKFNDNTIKVLGAMDDKVVAILEECAGSLTSAVKRNSRVGQPGAPTKNSWKYKVTKDGNEHIAVIGSNLENAIWEEFGTGEHAITENGGKGGRKGYWVFVKGSDGKSAKSDKSYTLKEAKKVMAILRSKGLEAYYTNGKKPSRAFWKAYLSMKNKIIRRIQNQLKGI